MKVSELITRDSNTKFKFLAAFIELAIVALASTNGIIYICSGLFKPIIFGSIMLISSIVLAASLFIKFSSFPFLYTTIGRMASFIMVGLLVIEQEGFGLVGGILIFVLGAIVTLIGNPFLDQKSETRTEKTSNKH